MSTYEFINTVCEVMRLRIDIEHKVFTRADGMYRKGYLDAIRDLKVFAETRSNHQKSRQCNDINS
jgi:hypothetical protein